MRSLGTLMMMLGAVLTQTASPVRAAEMPRTDVETVTRYLESEPRTWEVVDAGVGKPVSSTVRILSPEEAVSAIDEAFCKGYLPYGMDFVNYPRLKRLVKDGLVVAFAYDVVAADDVELIWRGCKNTHDFQTEHVKGSFTGYGYWLRTFDSVVHDDWHCHFAKTCVHPRICRGVEFLRTKDRVRGMEWTPRSEFDVLPFRVDRQELKVCLTNAPACEAVLVADVEDVALDSLVNLNASQIPPPEGEPPHVVPGGVYRVDLLVRQVIKGRAAWDRIVCRVNPRDIPYERYGRTWPFFRGLTLRLELCRQGGALCVCRIDPVLPYPPYTPATFVDDMCYRNSVSPRFRSIRDVDRVPPPNAVASVGVCYGDQMVARFYSTATDMTGIFGTYPDYARTCAVKVWTAREGVDSEYWHSSWFSDNAGYSRAPRVSVQKVEDGLGPEARLAFAWYGYTLPEKVRRTARTLGTLLDGLKRATVCRDCGKPHYAIDVAPAERRRVVNLTPDPSDGDAKAELSALDALKLSCSLAGCDYTVRRGVITVVPECNSADMSDESLKGRLRVLQKDGFASVAGADYVSIRSRWTRWTDKLEDQPIHEFSALDEGDEVSGNAWMRKEADGTARFLMFGSVWWPDAAEGDGKFVTDVGKARPLRDAAKMRVGLRDAPGRLKNAEVAARNDVVALAHALHLLQQGCGREAQDLYGALRRRPFASRAAFARLRLWTKRGRRYPDLLTWKKGDAEEPEEGNPLKTEEEPDDEP